MGDKFQNKNKNKKTTTKEKKAATHLKLMQGGKNKQENVVATIEYQKDKKAA